jgi:hypothetical protein
MQKAPPYVTIIIAGAIFLTLGYWLGNGRHSDTEPEPLDGGHQVARAAREIIDPEKAARDRRAEKDAENAEAQRRVLSHQAKVDAVELGDRAAELYDQALVEEKRWRDEIEPLSTNDEGRYIAANDENVKLFRTAYQAAKERPSRETLTAGKARVTQLVEPVRQTLDDRSAAPPLPELTQRLRAEKEKAADALKSYRESREPIEAVLAKAKREATPVDGFTLSIALANLSQAETALDLDAKRRVKEEEDAKRRADEEARERFNAQARDPALLAKFKPFLEKGLYTGGKVSNSNFLKEHGLLFEYPRPMSYQAITAADFYNVLNDVNLFYRMGCGLDEFQGVNDRTTWPKARSDADKQRYRNLWQEFRQWAPTWRELGILSR